MRDNGEITTEINENIQNRHYKGTSEYRTFLASGVEKSYFIVPMSELQQILNEKFSTGSIRFDRAGVPREIFDCGKPVAYDTELKRKTSFVKTHYSKNKTHLSQPQKCRQEALSLTCKEAPIGFYESFGYTAWGISDSVKGNVTNYDMEMYIDEK